MNTIEYTSGVCSTINSQSNNGSKVHANQECFYMDRSVVFNLDLHSPDPYLNSINHDQQAGMTDLQISNSGYYDCVHEVVNDNEYCQTEYPDIPYLHSVEFTDNYDCYEGHTDDNIQTVYYLGHSIGSNPESGQVGSDSVLYNSKDNHGISVDVEVTEDTNNSGAIQNCSTQNTSDSEISIASGIPLTVDESSLNDSHNSQTNIQSLDSDSHNFNCVSHICEIECSVRTSNIETTVTIDHINEDNDYIIWPDNKRSPTRDYNTNVESTLERSGSIILDITSSLNTHEDYLCSDSWNDLPTEYPDLGSMAIPSTVEEVAHCSQEQTVPIKEKIRKKKPKKTKNQDQNKSHKNRKLWQFLLDIVEDPKYNPAVMRWTDRQNGVFMISDNTRLAELWSRNRQTYIRYEFLARSLRHYYTKEILKKVGGKKLTYQFGEKEKWREYMKRK